MKDNVHDTSTDYKHPSRSFVINAANSIGRFFLHLRKVSPLHAESLMDTAVRRTGLNNFGDESFIPHLRVLCRSIRTEAGLTPLGELITKERLIGSLSSRLRAEHLFRIYPEILNQQLKPVIAVTGFQRTGTTILHRLLAAEEGIRSLASWEAINPAPMLDRTGAVHRKDIVKRQRLGRSAQKFLNLAAPDFFAVHPVEWNAPEEECLLLDYQFLSTVPEATLRVPTYSAYAEDQDNRPAYRYLKRLMKLLQWQHEGRLWVMKTPHHLEYLDLLLEEFPDIRIIQTHRRLEEALASFCSMICHGRSVFSDRCDPLEVGDHWSRKNKRLITRAMAVRQKADTGQFKDAYYTDFIRNPISYMQDIYRFLDIPFSDQTALNIKGRLNANRKDKYGHHRYRLEDFGLSIESVHLMFEEYYREFFPDYRKEKLHG